MKIKGAVIKGAGVVALIGVIVIFAMTVLDKGDKTAYMMYAEFLQLAENGGVREVVLSDNPEMQFTAADSDITYETDNPRSQTLKEDLLKLGISVKEGNYVSTAYVVQSAVSLSLFVAAFFVAFRILNKRGKGLGVMGLAVSDKTEENTSRTHFGDVAGNDEAKDSVTDIVDFIQNPEKYAVYGARMPRGVIFYGPPGTGKTLMAKAIAGEAGVPFYAVSGSDFVQMYVGVGASRVRDLFKKARENGKAVIFIDEIDALGKKRSDTPVGGNDERDQTLNALLTEMSGFSSTEGIVVIAATNRIDTLDEALLRPGRFDRQVEIGLPDMNGRLSILKIHAVNKPLSNDIDLKSVAKQTVYFSGAMLENLLNEAAISAAKKGSGLITQQDLDSAYYTVVAGSEKKDRSGIKERDRRITAFHESGHAIAAKLLSPENTVSKVTIIPSTKGAGGFCINIPPDKMYYTKKELEAQIIVSLAGRAAEETVFGENDITTGASNDFEKASSIVTDYITKYGMAADSATCGIKYVYAKNIGADKDIFTEYAAQMERFYQSAKVLIASNLDKLNSIASALLEYDTLNEHDIDRIMSA